MKVIPQLPLLGAMQAVYISAMSIMLSVSALTAAAIEGQVGKSTTPFVILAIGIAISAYRSLFRCWGNACVGCILCVPLEDSRSEVCNVFR